MPTLDWIGKEAVRQHHHEVPFHLLREVPELGAGDAEAGNLLIRGDNLVALKALLPTHAGTVKCIYIDPPYNTGNEGWVYNDNVNSPAIRAWLDRAVGKEAEDLGRHDKWLCMMYPRLVLLRELLAEDGSLWMSIDDNEVHHARALMDEVFGARNFICQIAWQKVYTVKNSASYLSEMHDHILVYALDKARWRPNLIARSAKQDDAYTNPDRDPRGPWKATPMHARNYYSKGRYPVETPSGRIIEGPPTGRYWAVSEEKFMAMDADGQVWWGEDGSNEPAQKRFLTDVRDGVVPTTMWFHEQAGHNAEAKNELRELLPQAPDSFVTPKPTRLIQRILEIATQPGDLVLDSFAGSGTTGHAVLKQNAEDGGDRRFILVEMEDEVAGPVTAERLKRAVEGYPFKGRDRTELYRQKLEVRNLEKAPDFYAETERLKTEHASDYDKIERKMDGAELVLTGVKTIKDAKPGLGGGFRFYEIGEPVYDADGRLNDAVPYEALGRYAYYAQAGVPLAGADAGGAPPLVGVTDDGTAVYLLGGGASGDGAAPSDVLDRSALDGLPAHDGPRVVWGTACRLGADLLEAHGVTFRQIPYDLRTR